MVRYCENCDTKVYLEGRFCPYCKFEFKDFDYKVERLSPAGKKAGFILAIIYSISLFAGSLLLIYAVFTHNALLSLFIMIFLVGTSLFTYLVGGTIANKLLSRREFVEKPRLPDLSPSESILDETDFLSLGAYNYIYKLFFTDNYIIFCYLDFWLRHSVSSFRNIGLKKRLKIENAELNLLKSDLRKLILYHGNNFYVAYDDIEDVVFRKNGFKIKTFSESVITGKREITFFPFYTKDIGHVLSLFKRYIPDRVREEEGRFLNL